MSTTPHEHWTTEAITHLFEKPFFDLLFQAQQVHRAHFNPHQIQISSLLNIKTGTCPEDCAYCPQSGHYKTGLEKEKLWEIENVKAAAKNAKANGATRFCMGAAWRSPPKKAFESVLEMIKVVKEMGLETCVTLGMLDAEQTAQLKEAGLDYYNHNLDTSREYYPKIITTRTYQERLDTLEQVRTSGIKVCCGGILGMGETREDRIQLLKTLANLPEAPKSVPINQLIPIPGTPLGNSAPIDPFEFIRVIAAARVLMPTSWVRLSAGRKDMSDEMQALCFFAGANSIFYGDKLLTAPNPGINDDQSLFNRLNLQAASINAPCEESPCQ